MAFVVDFTETFNHPSASNGWFLEADHDYVTYPNMLNWIDSSSPDPSLGGFVLFGAWGDGGPATRSLWHSKIFSGFAPGSIAAWHMHVSWALNTGPGSVFISIQGGDGSNYYEIAPDNAAFDFWTIPAGFGHLQIPNVLTGVADINGQIKVSYGAKGYGGSCNLTVGFSGVIEIGHVTLPISYGYIMKHSGSPLTQFVSKPIYDQNDELIRSTTDSLIYAKPTAQ